MVKASETALCVAAAAGCWVAAPSPAFLAGRSATLSPEVVPEPIAARAPTSGCSGTFSSAAPLAAVGMAGAFAVAVSQRSRRTSLRAETETKAIEKRKLEYVVNPIAFNIDETPLSYAEQADIEPSKQANRGNLANMKDSSGKQLELRMESPNKWYTPAIRDRTVTAHTAPVPFDNLAVDKFAGGLVGSEYAGFGQYQWDPLELGCKFPEHLPWYREAELKHGRLAMLGFVGLVAPDFFRIPMADFQGDWDFMQSHNQFIYGIGQGPMWWLLAFCGVVESLRFKELGFAFEKLTLENAGDLNFGKQFLPKTADGQVQMKIKELKNGRLAMLAIGGIITQSGYFTNHHFPWV